MRCEMRDSNDEEASTEIVVKLKCNGLISESFVFKPEIQYKRIYYLCNHHILFFYMMMMYGMHYLSVSDSERKKKYKKYNKKE